MRKGSSSECDRLGLTSRRLPRRELLRGMVRLGALPPALLLLQACGSSAPPVSTTVPAKPAESPQPATSPVSAAQVPPASQPAAAVASGIQDKTLRLRLFEDLRIMDPAFINTGTDSIVSEVVNSKLLQRNINKGQIEPDLAESWNISPDGKTYTFKLRKGVRWHRDYGEFTSADVKFSWDRIMDKTAGSQYYPEFEPVKSVETPDPYTVVVTTRDPYPAFISTVVAYTPGYIVNRKAIEDLKDKYVSSPIGTGPYEFVNWVPGASVDLKVFAGYFGRPQTIRDLHLVITKEDDVAELAVEKGDIDIAYVHGPEVQQRVVENRSLSSDVVPGPRIVHLQLNLARPPFDNLKVRQALQYATDKVSIVKYVLLDQAVVASTFLNPSMYAFENVELYPFDPAKAKALLAEAGFAGGLPKPLEFMVGVEKEYIDVTTAVQQQWAQAGIKSEIASVERAIGDKRRRTLDFDINVQAIARFEPSQYLVPYTSSAGIPFPNVMGYKGADDAILKGVVEPDDARRKELYVQAQRQIAQDSPIVPLYYPNFMIAFRPEIEGAKAEPTRVYNVRDIRFKL
jgi:peptide/nickel transport system substrate-binding protein